MVSSPTHPSSDLPAVDAPLVAEDCGYEIVNGRLVPVPPAHEPHGERHSKLNALLEAHAGDAFNVACDMLTRTSETTNIAPDASVYPMARDPATGGRQLELLAFEIVSTQSLSDAADKARRLADRGVRRVFGIDVPHQRVFEWSGTAGDWQLMADASAIDDEVFVLPLPVAALVKAAKADDAMAAALLAKGNPVLVAAQDGAREEGLQRGREEGLQRGREEGLQRGREEGLQRARHESVEAARRRLLVVADARGQRPTPAQLERIAACSDLARLETWLVELASSRDLDDVLGD
jgi:Uma2 family endonuclease